MTIELKRMPTTQPGPTTSNVIRTYAMPPSSNGRTTETRAYQRLAFAGIAGMPSNDTAAQRPPLWSVARLEPRAPALPAAAGRCSRELDGSLIDAPVFALEELI